MLFEGQQIDIKIIGIDYQNQTMTVEITDASTGELLGIAKAIALSETQIAVELDTFVPANQN